jgi:hypothetical protein
MGIESVVQVAIKEEFFNKIRPSCPAIMGQREQDAISASG